jgi:DNA polymerase delta subunit 1
MNVRTNLKAFFGIIFYIDFASSVKRLEYLSTKKPLKTKGKPPMSSPAQNEVAGAQPSSTSESGNSLKRPSPNAADPSSLGESYSPDTVSKRLKSDRNAPPSDFEMELVAQEAAKESQEPTRSPWKRPEVQQINPETDSMAFQWMDIDMYSGDPLKENPAIGERVPGSTDKPVPVVRLYGVNEIGNSVLAHVHGFTPYFLCSIPRSFNPNDCGKFRHALNAMVQQNARKSREQIKMHVMSVQVVRKQSLLGYHGDAGLQPFLQIHVAMPTLVPTARRVLEHGFTCPGYGNLQYQTYESNVPYVLRFMIDNEIVGCNWLECPAGAWSMRRGPQQKTGRCQIELDIVYTSLISHKPEGEWMKIAPLRVLSFDIECMGRKGHFPEAEKDPVIQIANTVTVHGEDKPRSKTIFVLDETTDIVGVNVDVSHDERDLLAKWAKYVVESDVDVLTGYNIQNFDLPYILNRAKALNVHNRVSELGRLCGEKATMRDATFSSAAFGKRTDVETSIKGRIVFDMIKYMRRNHKFSSYTLNAVSAHFLGQQKEDVHYSIISDLQRGSPDDRRRLAVYCLKDAYLPQKLMDKLYVMVNHIEMARVTGVPLDFLMSRGQQIKVLSMLYRKCGPLNLIIPAMQRSQASNGEGNGVAYEGATVIEPKRGFYRAPIATLDFASLYPSIMQAHNLCYSTLLQPQQVKTLDPSTYKRTPNGYYFVKSDVKKGILPEILEELLTARKAAKKDMKAAKDPLTKGVMNGRQLALKVSANSVYGFTGATVGQLPCLPISSSVTAYGREMIDATKAKVEELYTVENGYEANAEVIYGDTDSVMIKFGCKTVAEAIRLGEEAAPLVTDIFVNPIKLEFEKVYCPYLLMNKKRYAGLYWTRAEKFDKLDAKGIETVRRDNCGLTRQVVGTCLNKILVQNDVKGAIEYTKRTISDLLMNKVDISLLIISKSLSKDPNGEDYVNKQAHGELAKKMHKRDPATAPVVGDRVPYVMIQKGPKAKGYEKAEDPLYVLENNLAIDTQYYLTNQLSKPLTRIFEPITGSADCVLKGDHTRKVFKPTAKKSAGGLMGFVKKKKSCAGCRAQIPDKSGALCKHCKTREGAIFLQKQSKVKECEAKASKLWSQCQRCQGTLHTDILCSNTDCPIFYMRVKAKKDLATATQMLEKFSW